MSRLCVALIVTGMLLPHMLFPPPVEALMSTPPSIGHAAHLGGIK